ncbi:unnamed protein product [Symbiodinium sp. CCMP2456]|nr:unnamed protein product [Symbiodinium sp. CCMP2456]
MSSAALKVLCSLRTLAASRVLDLEKLRRVAAIASEAFVQGLIHDAPLTAEASSRLLATAVAVAPTFDTHRMDNFHTFLDSLKQHAKPLAEKAEMRKKLAATVASALIQAVAALAAPPAATSSAAAGARLAALALVQVAVKNSSDAALRVFVEDIVAEIASSSLKVTATSAPILRSAVEGVASAVLRSRGAGDAKVLCVKIFGKMLKTMSQTEEDLKPQYCNACRDVAVKAGAAHEIENAEFLFPAPACRASEARQWARTFPGLGGLGRLVVCRGGPGECRLPHAPLRG